MPKHMVRPEKRGFARRLRRHQTLLEKVLWHELRDRRLGRKFRRQVPIEGYVVDFVCLEARLVVEIDGPLHKNSEQRIKDAKRDAVLEQQGFCILRFDEEIAAGRIVDEIRRVLAKSPSPGH